MDNKSNNKYIISLADCKGTLQQADRQQPHNQYSNVQNYFTELGLYRCLFTSQKPIAIEFQEQVAIMLKNIRLGAIELIIKDVNRLTQELESANKTIAYATRHGVVYRLNIYSADGRQVQYVYIGSTKNYNQRMCNHHSGSSNPAVKELVDSGRQVVHDILEEVQYFQDDELLAREQHYIDQTDTSMLLNRMNAIQSVAPIRPAVGIEPCRLITDTEFNSRCDELKEFYTQLRRFPHDSVGNQGTREYQLAQFFNKVKQAKKQLDINPNINRNQLHYALTPQRLEYISKILADLQISHGFWIDLTLDSHQRDIDYIKQYKESRNQYPVDNTNDRDTMNGWSIIRKWRNRHKNNTLSDRERQLITSQLPDFMFDHHAETLQLNINELCAFIVTNKHPPLQKENKKLQTLFVNMQKNPTKYSEQQIAQLKASLQPSNQ